jgi:hypothetical protein
MLSATSNATQLQVSDPNSSVSKIVKSLVANRRYEEPKIVSFPIDGMRVTGPVSLAGNIE